MYLWAADRARRRRGDALAAAETGRRVVKDRRESEAGKAEDLNRRIRPQPCADGGPEAGVFSQVQLVRTVVARRLHSVRRVETGVGSIGAQHLKKDRGPQPGTKRGSGGG